MNKGCFQLAEEIKRLELEVNRLNVISDAQAQIIKHDTEVKNSLYFQLERSESDNRALTNAVNSIDQILFTSPKSLSSDPDVIVLKIKEVLRKFYNV